MAFLYHCSSPVGGITLASDGEALTGLWFDGQKYFAETPGRKKTPGRKAGSLQEYSFEREAGPLQEYSFEREAVPSLEDSFGREAASGGETITGRYAASGPKGEAGVLPVFDMTCRWLDVYFSGREPDFRPLLRLQTTKFRREVWEILLSIPFGKTMTYGEIADLVGEKQEKTWGSGGTADRAGEKQGKTGTSARAVGGAVGHNPISLIIPCHRVIGSDGSLTGYAGGLEKKMWLLRHEGILR